jgi:hypothetical protein
MNLRYLAPILVVAACSDAPSKEESVQIFAAASTAMTSAQSAAVTQAQGAALTAPADLVLDFTGACSLGGSVAIAGSYSGDGSSSQATFDLATTFDACHELQGTLDGDIHWTSAATGTSFTAAMTGDLAWDGSDGSASCTLDLHIAVGQLGASYTGSVCGYDVTTDLTLPH